MSLSVARLAQIFPKASKSFLEANATIGFPAKKNDSRTILEPKKPQSETSSTPAVLLERPDGSIKSIIFTIPLSPIGKPRMTQRDRWYKDPNHADPKKRQRVRITRYEEWKAAATPHVPELPQAPKGFNWTAYVEFPKSYSAKKRKQLSGQLHTEKPDRDNIDKTLCDFLFKQDKSVAYGTICKRWDDGRGARIEIEIIP